MASPKPPDDDIASPARRIPSTPNTPRRNVAAKRVNGTSPKTPIRKTSGNVIKTPNTAPARTKTSAAKKVEPTLLGDFLLGRPSPARHRRKSLDVVRQELKEANVGAVKLPGGVKDRVQKWQKASSAAAVDDPNAELVENHVKAKEKEETDDGSVDEEERLRIKYRGAKRPGRRKSREEDQEANESDDHERSRSAPRKRVISDDHWMMAKSPKKTPANKRNISQKIPKDFLTKTTVKEPLSQRVQDWIKISEGQGLVVEKEVKPKSRKSSRQEPKPTEEIDDGIRVRPRPTIGDDEIRVKSLSDKLRDETVEDGIKIKPMRKDGSKRRPKDPEPSEEQTPTRRQEKHFRPSGEFTSKSRANSHGSRRLEEDDDKISSVTPSPLEKSKRKTLQSETPSELSDIPFGNSAFSVLDLPVGAEAGTMRRPPPKRAPSFGVPKVLKKVYNAVHDGAAPKAGPNQPASIESWLNGTSDPFVERPTSSHTIIDVPTDGLSRNASYKKDDPLDPETIVEHEISEGSRRKRRSRTAAEKSELEGTRPDITPLESPKTRDTLPSMGNLSPISPTGLKRSPATRNSSSPKTARKSMFKSAIFDAFKGESSMAGQTDAPNPFAEITGLRERDVNRAPDLRPIPQEVYEDETPPKRIPQQPEKLRFEEPVRARGRPFQEPRGPPPTGGHRLSTIASVETFGTSSATDTASELSHTTITQESALTKTTASSISRKSNNRPSKPGVKRRLTKHSDLISVLSLPDPAPAQQGRSRSIRSARSIRTTRAPLAIATVQDLMREVAEDEVKYMRELKTLVDGVIPVLLTCVLSKSDSALAAGLFSEDDKSPTDSTFTKPIVDMGVALEQLKSLHKRIPLDNAEAFIMWAIQSHKIYQDYLASWRTGFEDVVVNLAPASRSASADDSALDEMPRNEEGDLVGRNGDRVDVAYLLKRPLVRVKYIHRALKGLYQLDPSEHNMAVQEMFDKLEGLCRTRASEEASRQVDLDANRTDPARARDPRTLKLMEGVKIDRTRQVCAKDFFSFDFTHSNGQRIECRVELILRDKMSDPNDADLLVCDTTDYWPFLLFRPISKDLVSSRLGDKETQVVVMIRGVHESNEWYETFLLETDDQDTAAYWVKQLGTYPIPPQLNRKEIDARVQNTALPGVQPSADHDIPIGERRRREAEETATPRPRSKKSRHSQTPPNVPDSITEESIIGEPVIKDLNDAMMKSGAAPAPVKRARAARYHSRAKSTPTAFVAEMAGALNPYPEERSASPTNVQASSSRTSSPDPSIHSSMPYNPKVRSEPTTPLKESMRPELNIKKKRQSSDNISEDVAPAPPPHRTTPSTLKNTPVLDSPTPRAKARRSSSPLKHEYQPSDGSTSSPSDVSDSPSDSYSESSDEDDLEAAEIPSASPHARASPTASLYNIPGASVALAPSALAIPQIVLPVQPVAPVDFGGTFVAMISGWSDKDGRWIDLHPAPCSIVISAGRISVYEVNAATASPIRDLNVNPNASVVSLAEYHILDQVLTPIIQLRQSNAVDIEIRSPPSPVSRQAARAYRTIRYRSSTANGCQNMYRAVHKSRLNNPAFKKLEEDRRISGFGQNNYSDYQADRRKRWVFGRKKSYRVSHRAPSVVAESEKSGTSQSTAFSALLKSSAGSLFNIARSTIYNGTNYSGPTPPRTPTSGSLMGSSYSNGVLKPLTNEDIKIRLYQAASPTTWDDYGVARLSVTVPPPGMRQASTLSNGIERRIVVTHRPGSTFFGRDKENTNGKTVVVLDVILGAGCYTFLGRTGVAVNIWEDVVGPNGQIAAVGGVSGGRTRKWLFQTARERDARWIYSLVAVGR